jgi:hypothetical protein
MPLLETVEEWEEFEEDCSKIFEVEMPKMAAMGYSNIKRGMTDRGEIVDSQWEFTAITYWRLVEGAVVERNESDFLLYIGADGKQHRWYYDLRINSEPAEVKGQFHPNDHKKMEAHPHVRWILGGDIKEYERALNLSYPGWRSGFIETHRGVFGKRH